MAEKTTSMVSELRPGIYLFRATLGSHVYLLRGDKKNVLVDTGDGSAFPQLRASLRALGLRPRDIHLILLTHEHFDHIGATAYFPRTAVVAAHRLAANKIELQDDFVTFMKYFNPASRPFQADLWLEDDCLVDLGNYKLRCIHTPGHTSGCICLYELKERLLFSGDTVFIGGALSGITPSGSISDYMNSLQRLTALKVTGLCSGHGRLSDDPEGDILRGLEQARDLFEDTKTVFDALSRKRRKA